MARFIGNTVYGFLASKEVVQKPYARKMECLAKVWDGSSGEVGDNLGFLGCMAERITLMEGLGYHHR